MKDIFEDVQRLRANGERLAIATIVASRNSAPRPIGTNLVVSESGEIFGSVSGGCAESDVFQHAQQEIATGTPKLVSYGFREEDAWEVGLPCGGEIDIFIERLEHEPAAG